MKWIKREPKPKEEIKICSKRVIRKFLLYPKTIDYETRWLEYVTIEQIWNGVWWSDRKWVDC
jgi:hypothetical protein